MLEIGWITVAGVLPYDSSRLAGYTSKIGEKAKNWGIPTNGKHTVKFEVYEVGMGGGTSFAAPVVTAAAANVWNKFLWMSNHLVVVSRIIHSR